MKFTWKNGNVRPCGRGFVWHADSHGSGEIPRPIPIWLPRIMPRRTLAYPRRSSWLNPRNHMVPARTSRRIPRRKSWRFLRRNIRNNVLWRIAIGTSAQSTQGTSREISWETSRRISELIPGEKIFTQKKTYSKMSKINTIWSKLGQTQKMSKSHFQRKCCPNCENPITFNRIKFLIVSNILCGFNWWDFSI